MSEDLDAARAIRLVTAAVAIAASVAVFVLNEPTIAVLNERLDAARSERRSGDIAVRAAAGVARERDRLRERYLLAVGADSESVFFGDLDGATNRHRVDIVSLDRNSGDPSDADLTRANVAHDSLVVELRGGYRAILATMIDLSRGAEPVAVHVPSFRRDGVDVTASIPLTLLDPVATFSERHSRVPQ